MESPGLVAPTRAEIRFRALMEATRDGLAVLCQGRLVHGNTALLRCLGEERLAPLFDTPLIERLVPEDRLMAAQHIDAAEAGEDSLMYAPSTVRVARADGALDWMEWSAEPLEGDEVLVCLHPIGELRALQRAVEESESLASVGALALGVAHELSNPLSFVHLCLTWLDEDLPRDDPGSWDRLRRVQEGLAGTRRLARIIEDLQAYARADLEAVTRVRLDRVLETALGLALHRVRHQASVHWERTEGDLATLAAEGKVVRLLVDLLLTATRSFTQDKPQHNQVFMRTGEAGAGPWVEVECRSPHGVGLDPVASEDAPLVRAARDLGGELISRDLPEGHRLVRLWLPPAPQRRAEPHLTELTTGQCPTRQRLRVLLVDDEPLICRSLSLSLERSCEVTSVTAGEEAIALLGMGAAYDVVLLDVMMPPPAGPEIWAHIQEHRPELVDQVVFITGGATTVTARQLLAGTQAEVLAKPIDLNKLRHLVRRVGARSEAAPVPPRVVPRA